MQIDEIFTNVSKGNIAKQKDLELFKPISDKKQIIMEILNKGELQVSEMERDDAHDRLKKGVASIICEKCFDTSNMSEFSQQVILKAFTDLKLNIKPNQPAKKQALKIMVDLEKALPIERMKIRMKFTVGQDQLEQAKNMIKEVIDAKEYELEQQTEKEMLITYEPLWFREFDNILQELKSADPSCSIEILDNNVIKIFADKKSEMDRVVRERDENL